MVNNAFLDTLSRLTEGLDLFRQEQGILADPDADAVRRLVGLETELLVRLYLGQSFDAADMETRLKHAYGDAVVQRVIDTESLAAAYARLLPTLKAPLDDPIWAEDACLYNQYLEAHLAHRDYATMLSLMMRQQVEALVASVQEQRGLVGIS